MSVQERMKSKKEDLVDELLDEFNKNKGDEIDRHIFMKDIMEYLEVNIDGIRKKNNLKRESTKYPASRLFPLIDNKSAYIHPSKIMIAKNFDVNAYREKLAGVESVYSRLNLPTGMS